MNKSMLRRIGFSAIVAAALCFAGSIEIVVGNNETLKMTIIEFVFKHDRTFFMGHFITLFNVADAGLASLWLIILLPFITSLPGLFGFADTMQGFWRMEYIRKSKRSYRIKKFFTVCTSGAISVILGYLLYVLTIIPFFPYYIPYNTTSEDGLSILVNEPPPVMEFISGIASNMGILFLVSFLTSAVCLCIFLALKNRYKAVGMPLIVYYLLYEIAIAMYGKFNRDVRMYIFSPYFIVNYGKWIAEAFSMPYICFYIGLMLIIVGLYALYAMLLNRRLER